MRIRGIKNVNTLEEIKDAVEDLENPYNWEEYCTACDNFETEYCPFRDKVNIGTKWRKLGCNCFWD